VLIADAVNDVVVSYLLYQAIMDRATALGMSLDARDFATSVPGRPVAGGWLGITKQAAATKMTSTAPNQTQRADRPDGVAREQYAVYTEFVAGREVSDLAYSLAVKETVIQ